MSSVEQHAETAHTLSDGPVFTPYLPNESAGKRALPVRPLRRQEQANPVKADGLPRQEAQPVARAGLAVWWATRGVWLGFAAWLLALAGTLLLVQEASRTQAEVMLIVAGVLALVAWGSQKWASPFASPGRFSFALRLTWRHWLSLGGLALGGFTVWLADATYLAHQNETFGAAGWLWLLGMGILVIAALLWPRPRVEVEDSPVQATRLPAHVESTLPVRPVAYNPRQSDLSVGRTGLAWTGWEVGALGGIFALSLFLRLWDLPNFPYAFNYDEINTGVVAHAYINGLFPSVFSTMWDNINLPALWFSIIAGSLNLFGTSMVGLRVPAALFSAVTVLPLYGIVRQAWGRTAAIACGIIFSFSAVELNYSRITLNNIVTPFFWTVCFFFVLRGLRTRQPIDWLLAGLAGGLGEHFYYGTRLLPFLLIGFMVYLLVIHWRQGWRYLGHFGVLALGYLAGFGPLLAYFNTVRRYR